MGLSAIYARQSVDKKDSISIESQIEFCRGQCVGETVEIYSDKGYSGKDIKRPAFSRLLDDVRGERISKVVVYKLDRMSRSLLDFANLIELFRAYHVEFVSTQEKFDTSTPMGNAMLSITMVFAQLERETIQQRITDNYYQRGKRGMFLGGKPPYGFRIAKTARDGKQCKLLEAVAGEAETVARLFDLYGRQGQSLGEIAKALNAQGILTRTQGRWSGLAVGELLRNPNYVQADCAVYRYYQAKGCVLTNDIADFADRHACCLYGKRTGTERKYASLSGRTVSLALHEGFIEPGLFLDCQHRLDNNRQIPRDGMGSHSWLSGLLKCGKCGYCMTVVFAAKNEVYYLRCSGRSNGRKCPGHSVAYHRDDVEKIAEEQLLGAVRRYGGLTCRYEEDGRRTREQETAEMELARIAGQIERLVGQLAEENPPVTRYVRERIARLDRQKQELQDRLRRWEDEAGGRTVRLGELAELWPRLSVAQKKEFAREMFAQVVLTDGEVNIVWRYRLEEAPPSAPARTEERESAVP